MFELLNLVQSNSNIIQDNGALVIIVVPLVIALIDKTFSNKPNSKSESKESVKEDNTYVDRQLTRANINTMQVLSNKIENSKYQL